MLEEDGRVRVRMGVLVAVFMRESVHRLHGIDRVELFCGVVWMAAERAGGWLLLCALCGVPA